MVQKDLEIKKQLDQIEMSTRLIKSKLKEFPLGRQSDAGAQLFF